MEGRRGEPISHSDGSANLPDGLESLCFYSRSVTGRGIISARVTGRRLDALEYWRSSRRGRDRVRHCLHRNRASRPTAQRTVRYPRDVSLRTALCGRQRRIWDGSPRRRSVCPMYGKCETVSVFEWLCAALSGSHWNEENHKWNRRKTRRFRSGASFLRAVLVVSD